MKLTIEVEKLRSAVNAARAVVDRVQTMPILSNILIEATDENEAVFIATDLNVELKVKVDIATEHAGSTTVQAAIFGELVRHLPDESQVGLTLDENDQLIVAAGRSEFNLSTLSPGDFPRMAEEEFDTTFSAPSGSIKRLFAKSKIAISKDESRRYLNGVYFHFSGGEDESKLKAVATDGYILARSEMTAPEHSEDMEGVIVPEKSVVEVTRILDEKSEDVTVSVSAGKIRFETDQISYTSRVIDAKFPDYERLIPTNTAFKLAVDPGELLRAVQRVSAVSLQQVKSVNMKMESDRLELNVSAPGHGVATDVIPAEFPHDTTTIKFGHRHLIGILAEMEKKQISFNFNSPKSATVVFEEGGTDTLFVVMPLKV